MLGSVGRYEGLVILSNRDPKYAIIYIYIKEHVQINQTTFRCESYRYKLYAEYIQFKI